VNEGGARVWAFFAIVAANLVGGSTYVGQALARGGLPPATVILLRNLVAMACLWLWTRPGGGLRLTFTRREHARLALLGLLAYAAPLLLGIVGQNWSTAGNASILILLEPVSIVFFAWLLLREHVRPVQALGLLAGLCGALVIVLETAGSVDLLAADHLKGNAILAAHGLLWGLYSPLMAPLVATRRSLDVTFASMVWALALLVPASLLEASDWHAGPTLLPALGWTLALGVLASFGATVLWVWSLRSISPATVAPFVFLQPLAGVLAGHLVLGEVLSGQAALGGTLIGAGVVLVVLPARRRPSLPT
jgi:drug/metabolite transporter (DMT)-like permease